MEEKNKLKKYKKERVGLIKNIQFCRVCKERRTQILPIIAVLMILTLIIFIFLIDTTTAFSFSSGRVRINIFSIDNENVSVSGDTVSGKFENLSGRFGQRLSKKNAPTINFVSLNRTIAPFDGGVRKFEFSFIANDNDGTSDLNDTTAIANISRGTESYSNSSCYAEGDVTGGRNYSCTIEMQYFWSSGSWNYAVEIKDNSERSVQNSSSLNGQTLFYSELIALNLSTSALTWGPITPSETNQTSLSNPIVVENTGNKDELNIRVQAIDLGGASGRYIPANNFTIGNVTSSSKAECDYLNKTISVTPGVYPLVFVNATNIYPILNALVRGQGSSENLYYCLFDVPANIISEAYTTDFGGSWDISVE